jgi:crossover junction endodeoxyribonuclease RuvC
MVIGVDPGLNGGLALLDESGSIVFVSVMPRIGKLLDVPGLRRVVVQFVDRGGDGCHAYIEQAAAMPRQGSVSTFKFGRVYGIVEGLLAGMKIPYTLVLARKWQAVGHQGVEKSLDPKSRSLVAVQRLYPGADRILRGGDRARKPHDGIVDAVLIARWGLGFGRGGAVTRDRSGRRLIGQREGKL